jgi:hypothetical protein
VPHRKRLDAKQKNVHREKRKKRLDGKLKKKLVYVQRQKQKLNGKQRKLDVAKKLNGLVEKMHQTMTLEIPEEVFPQLLRQLLLLLQRQPRLLLLLQRQPRLLLLLQRQPRLQNHQSKRLHFLGVPSVEVLALLFCMGREKLFRQLKRTYELILKILNRQTDYQKYLGLLIDI